MGKKFYGLTGTKLNIAIAVVAGTDFALFGYGMFVLMCVKHSLTVQCRSRCYGWSAHTGLLSEILP